MKIGPVNFRMVMELLGGKAGFDDLLIDKVSLGGLL